jgi:hypothetical protein
MSTSRLLRCTWSAPGTTRTSGDVRYMVAIGGRADLEQGTFNNSNCEYTASPMSSSRLILKHAAGRFSGQWSDDFDVSPRALSSAGSCETPPRRKPRSGSGASPTATTRTDRRRTATRPRAWQLWPTSQRAGGGSRSPARDWPLPFAS